MVTDAETPLIHCEYKDFFYTGSMKKIQFLLAGFILFSSVCSGEACAGKVHTGESKEVSQKALNHAEEPSYCQSLQPSAADRLALPEWVLGSGSVLKRQGCWKSHIHWGELALETVRKHKQFSQERALLLSLASSFFYLGEYAHCLSFAKAAETLSDPKKDWRSIVESLYLQSAVARAKNDGGAVSLAEKALPIIDQQKEPAPFLRGKVLYNLAAALTDGKERNLERAREALVNAETLFKEAGNQYDVVRAVIRLARVNYLQGRYSQALTRLNGIQFQLGPPRTRMLFYQQRAKVLLAMKEWQKAEVDAGKAKELAMALYARKDLDRIALLQKRISERSTVIND
ncbi:tetratricopeptide repeat protein [Endozoicomonas euniceicola]|uniref:MalT-like TPR region domain-containing protein n=1 Tax=Endozoicomonas euniceicola TaxID=1234143 RepID=A0ABY6GQV0_9GAMM|nr:hypothetical protein [Endozoicomonas euniceicola]UYM15128.1 hypothetical protein NX720_20015 [Endozoicomonas euniceicola]